MSEQRPTVRHGGLSDELRPYVDNYEADEIDRLGERLGSARPIPRPAFRSELHAQLAGMGAAREAWRPRRLRVLVCSYLGSGLALLAVAAVSLVA